MIINKAHDFGFIHIPKCAGSTIRQQLRDHDDANGKFYHTMTVEGLGFINGNHVPLAVLAEYFPEDFAALQAVTSYAITRDPLRRFVSGVSQYLRRDGVEPGSLSATQITAKTQEIIADLSEPRERPETRHTVFYRQTGYIYLNGEKIIDHVFPMNAMDPLFDQIETRHGLSLKRDQVWNPTVTYRVPMMAGPLKRMKGVARNLLPVHAYASLRDRAVQTFTTKGAPKLEETLMASEDVGDFVAEYYEDDIQLHRAAQQPFEVD